jgi:membrane-bound lytic murein transglycosylase B
VGFLKLVLYCIIVLAGILLVCPAHAALSRTDADMLTQVFHAAGFTTEEAQSLLADHRLALHPEILNQKGEGIDYLQPRFGLLNRSSIQRGKRVLKEHRATLKRIEASYGVPREVLVAIFRVETNLGSNLGRYRVFNSLLTLTVMVNRRSAWALQELVNLLTLCKDNAINPFSIKGSWAGAFGLCQFVPSSYLTYGTDGNGDGLVDLFDFSDAMASTANYLRSHGWHSRDREKQFHAIWAYNHCDNYVKAVLAYSKQVKPNPTLKSRAIRNCTTRLKGVKTKGLTPT